MTDYVNSINSENTINPQLGPAQAPLVEASKSKIQKLIRKTRRLKPLKNTTNTEQTTIKNPLYISATTLLRYGRKQPIWGIFATDLRQSENDILKDVLKEYHKFKDLFSKDVPDILLKH